MKLLKLGIILFIAIIGFTIILNWDNITQTEVIPIKEDSVKTDNPEIKEYEHLFDIPSENNTPIRSEQPQTGSKHPTTNTPKPVKAKQNNTPKRGNNTPSQNGAVDATKRNNGATDAVKKEGAVDAVKKNQGAVDAYKR